MTQSLDLLTLVNNAAPVRTRDRLNVRLDNLGAAFTFTAGGRVLKPDGTVVDIQLDSPIGANSTNNELEIQMLDGWLLSFQANAEGVTINQGDVWVEAFLGFGAGGSTQRYRTLFTGYLDQFSALGWPNVDRRVPRESPGRIIVLTPTGGTPGTEWAFTISGNAALRPMAVSAILTTNATVANRSVEFTIEETGGGIIARLPFETAQTASLAWQYTATLGANHIEDTVTGSMLQALPGILMSTDYVIRSAVTNLQAGDDWSEILATGERWNDVIQ